MRVLVVDDELSMREYLEVLLARAGHEVATAPSVAEGRAALESQSVDLVISDMKLGSGSGIDVLRAARAKPAGPEVILITAYGTPAAAVEAMRQGAYDYICKPFDNDELLLLVQKALEKRELLRENRSLRDRRLPGEKGVFPGASPAMKAVWALVDRVAQSPRATVLITGESGTGKEVIARAIHLSSGRAAHPFVPVNCGALAEGVLESELFGHVRGAFTGATADRQGILVSAKDGTVLLDEVGELSPSTQVKLLRVLQERKVKPVGASTEVGFEARVLAATNKDLEAEVKAGRFREDLLFRLNVIAIEVPPLRQRREDIPELARFILARLAAELGRPRLEFAPETLALLERYSFSGNVRQLENLVERAATLSMGDLLLPESLPPAVRGEPESVPPTELALAPGFSLERYLDEAERRHLIEGLRKAGGVKTRAAELLGLSFRSFRYRLAKHGLGERDD
jgi:two-component system, NtrC family, response regulator PilR